MESYKANAEIMKINLYCENVGGLGVKATKKESNRGQNCRPQKSTTEILKNNLVVENVGGLGMKKQRTRVNWGQNLHEN